MRKLVSKNGLWLSLGRPILAGLMLALGALGGHAIPAAAARDISVGVNPAACGGPCNYTDINAALGAAANGDTIWVYAGQYKGPVVIDKSVTLIAAGDRGSTVIDGTGEHAVITITASGARLAGFTIQNSNKEGIVILRANNVVVQGNAVTGTGQIPPTSFTDVANAILINAGKSNQILDNWVHDNGGRGIRIEGFAGVAEGNLVRGNYVRNSRGGCGIVTTTNVVNNIIEYNRLEQNVEGGIIVAVLTPDAVAKGNVFQYNEVKWTKDDPGILVSLTVGPNPDRISGNIFRHNFIEANEGYVGFPASRNTGIVLNRVTGNEVYGNRIWHQDTGIAVTTPLSVTPNKIHDNEYLFVATGFMEGPAPAAPLAPAPAPQPAAPAALPRTGETPLAASVPLSAAVLGFGLLLVGLRLRRA